MLLYDLTLIGLIIVIISLFVGLIYGVGYISLQSSKKVNIYIKEFNNNPASEEIAKIEQENYKKKKDKIINQKFQETVASYNEYYNEQTSDGKIVGIAEPLGPLSEKEFRKRKVDIADMIQSVEEENASELYYHDAQHRMHTKAKREKEERKQREKQQQGYNTHQENVRNNRKKSRGGRSM
ncbi:MAG: hypothetical protein OEY79_04645 [Anaplasmataceae bacterium]|nr:hypothetical protein [Anaplasmataceae bacterium]